MRCINLIKHAFKVRGQDTNIIMYKDGNVNELLRKKVSNMTRHHVGQLPESLTELDDDSQQVAILCWCSLQIIWTAETMKLIQSQKKGDPPANLGALKGHLCRPRQILHLFCYCGMTKMPLSNGWT